MGFETPVKGDLYEHHEENRTHETFHVGAAGITAGSAGDSKTVVLEGDDLGTGGAFNAPLNSFYPRVGNVVTFPNEVAAAITDIDVSTPTAPIITIEPLNVLKIIPTMAAGDPIIITSMIWAEGSGQPAPALKGTTKYVNEAQIIKEAIQTTGSQLVTETWFTKLSDGQSLNGYWSVGLMDLDYRMSLAIDGMLLFGERQDNSLVDPVNGFALKGSEGIFPFIRRTGQVEPIAAGAFAVNDFNSIDRYLDQQGVSKNTLVMPGINLHQNMEDVLKGYFQDTNIVYAEKRVNTDIFKSDQSLGAAVNFKYLVKSERCFMFKRFNNLNNPKTFGVTNAEGVGSYNMPDQGLFLPIGYTKDVGGRGVISNIGCRYRAAYGYSRRMEIWNVAGAGTGLKVSEFDNKNTYQRCHMGAHYASGNQMVLVTPS